MQINLCGNYLYQTHIINLIWKLLLTIDSFLLDSCQQRPLAQELHLHSQKVMSTFSCS